MSTDQDQARLIAERVARRVSGGRSGAAGESSSRVSRSNRGNGAPVSEELTAIRTGLHDLERKLELAKYANNQSFDSMTAGSGPGLFASHNETRRNPPWHEALLLAFVFLSCRLVHGMP